GGGGGVARGGGGGGGAWGAMLPLAPGGFSTTMGWPSRSDRTAPKTRAIRSEAPPGGNETSSLIGRFGKVSARTGVASAASAHALASRMRTRRMGLLHLGAGELHQRRPARDLAGEERGEILWRAGVGDGAELGQRRLALRRLEAVVDRRVEPGDDLGRRAGGRRDPGPRVDGEIGKAAFHQRRHVGQLRPALTARDRERAHPAVADQ